MAMVSAGQYCGRPYTSIFQCYIDNLTRTFAIMASKLYCRLMMCELRELANMLSRVRVFPKQCTNVLLFDHVRHLTTDTIQGLYQTTSRQIGLFSSRHWA